MAWFVFSPSNNLEMDMPLGAHTLPTCHHFDESWADSTWRSSPHQFLTKNADPSFDDSWNAKLLSDPRFHVHCYWERGSHKLVWYQIHSTSIISKKHLKLRETSYQVLEHLELEYNITSQNALQATTRSWHRLIIPTLGHLFTQVAKETA